MLGSGRESLYLPLFQGLCLQLDLCVGVHMLSPKKGRSTASVAAAKSIPAQWGFKYLGRLEGPRKKYGL